MISSRSTRQFQPGDRVEYIENTGHCYAGTYIKSGVGSINVHLVKLDGFADVMHLNEKYGALYPEHTRRDGQYDLLPID